MCNGTQSEQSMCNTIDILLNAQLFEQNIVKLKVQLCNGSKSKVKLLVSSS